MFLINIQILMSPIVSSWPEQAEIQEFTWVLYLSLPPTRHDLTQGQKPEGRLKYLGPTSLVVIRRFDRKKKNPTFIQFFIFFSYTKF